MPVQSTALWWRYFYSSSPGQFILNHLPLWSTASTTTEYDDNQRYSESLFTVSFLRCSGRFQGSKQIRHKGLATPNSIYRHSDFRGITGSQMVHNSRIQCDSNTPCKGVDQEREKSNCLYLLARTERGRTRGFGDTALDRWTPFSNGDKHLNHNSTQGQFCFHDEIMWYRVSNLNGMVRSRSGFWNKQRNYLSHTSGFNQELKMRKFSTTSKKADFRIASSMVALAFLLKGIVFVLVCFNRIDQSSDFLNTTSWHRANSRKRTDPASTSSGDVEIWGPHGIGDCSKPPWCVGHRLSVRW